MSGVLQALLAGFGGAATDEYFEYVTMLLPGNGTNGAQNNTFLDSSTNNFTITRNGNTTQGTFTPYGSNWSNYFDGSDDLNAPSNAAFTYGTSDFTIEGWFFITGRSGPNSYEYLFAQGSSTGTSSLGLYREGGVLKVWNGSTVITGTTTLALNTWNHIALSRSGTTMRLFLNGVQEGSATNSNSISTGSTYGISVGRWTEIDTNYIVGYVSNFRVVKGTAVYTSAFTPSTSPLTAITNTSLLTCQSNRFIDNSSNNFTLTRNGDVSVQRFSPFAPTTPYAAGTIGGSGYFDGVGDYLNCGSNAALRPGTSDYTIEMWVYLPTFSTDMYLITQDFNNAGGSFGNFLFYADNTTGTCKFFSSTTGSSWNVINALNMGTLRTNEWTHFAVARQSGTVRTFRNGDLIASTSDGSADLSNTGNLLIATYGANIDTNAYMSGIRLQKGTAQYTASFTCPTAPPTAITNTSLLLNFTNGGIIDNAMMNDLETVGNAQISTSVSKFGGGSLAFDGNGDYLTIPPTQQLNFGSGNFTLEFWAYLNTTSGSQAVWHTSNFAGDTPGGVYIRVVSGAIEFAASTDDTYGTRVMVTSSTSLSATTWTHVACVRNGNTLTIYINGTSSGSATFSGSAFWSSTYYTRIGYWRDGDIQYLNAYLDDFRITKYARYTSNFSVPTAPFPLS